MLLSVFLPLFNFLVLACFGRFVGQIGTIWLSFFTIFLAFVLNAHLASCVFIENTQYFINLGSWINVELLTVNWEFILDPLSVTILAIVSLISFIVHIYSFSYIKNDPHFIRFISYLSLFTFFIFILVTANNFIQLFLGWEGVGICSYLLINFWFTRIQANKAAIKALIMNRFGDIGYLLGVVFVFVVYNTVDFTTLHLLAFADFNSLFFSKTYAIYYRDVICFCFLIGVAGKSAQLGLHTWLPAAIEGPTPVSALIHAATIVTAGIFLIIRTSFLFELSPTIKALVVILGAVTAFLSALTAIFLYDIKKVIAYSTCSQLGYMAVACGLSQYSIGLFHLVNHAFFKALLFLTAGAIIHSINNEQDIRKLSGLATRAPFILAAILIGNIAIIGLPFLSGFYSKDLVIELSFLTEIATFELFGTVINSIFILIMFATFATAVYSVRLFYFLFIRRGTFQQQKGYSRVFTQPLFIQVALTVLILGSIFGGYLLSDIFSPSSDFFYYTNFTADAPAMQSFFYFENEFLPWSAKIAPLFCNLGVLLGASWFFVKYNKKAFPSYARILLSFVSTAEERLLQQQYALFLGYRFIFFNLIARVGVVVKLFQNNFYFNEFYNFIAMSSYSYFYTNIFLNLDKGFLELLGPRGASFVYLWVTKKIAVIYKQGMSRHLLIVFNTLLALLYIFNWFL